MSQTLLKRKMIYVFKTLIRSENVDLNRFFDSLQTSPEVSKQVQHVTGLRNEFYSTFEQIQSRPMNEVNNSLEWMPLFEYLTCGVELLNLAVKKANYPINFNYHSFTFPSRTIGIHDGNSIKWSPDNEVAGTMEIILSRITYATGLLRSCGGHIAELRSCISQNNSSRAGEVLKVITDRILNACIRLHKMLDQKTLIVVRSSH